MDKWNTASLFNHILKKKTQIATQESQEIVIYIFCSQSTKTSKRGGCTFAVRTAKDLTLRTKKTLKSFKSQLWKVPLNSQKIKGSFDIN